MDAFPTDKIFGFIRGLLMLTKLRSSPVLARVAPFAVFVALTMVQGRLGEASQYWIYALKTLIGAWMLWQVRSSVREMRWSFSWEAVTIGVAVLLAWVGLEGHYPLLSARTETFNPIRTYGAGSALASTFIAIRLLGSSLVVPPLEEVFYRSFLYRYLIQANFLRIPLGHFALRAFLIAGLAFGISHYEWLPSILCAFAYQALVCRKDRLGDAITAHAITNFLLALYVIFRPAYYFW
jgi:uncharacterized protein